jgi:hypothetical protein
MGGHHEAEATIDCQNGCTRSAHMPHRMGVEVVVGFVGGGRRVIVPVLLDLPNSSWQTCADAATARHAACTCSGTLATQ